MGYFANGAEGMDYEEQYCDKCIHAPDYTNHLVDCPILTLHSMWNYEQHNDTPEGKLKNLVLTELIPYDKKGFNRQCNMFVRREK